MAVDCGISEGKPTREKRERRVNPRRALSQPGAQPNLLCEAEIVAASGPIDRPQSGIYFLIRDDRIVYVGQSVHVEARLAAHAADMSKAFDKAVWYPCPRESLSATERAYLSALLPEYNNDPITLGLKRAANPPLSEPDIQNRDDFGPEWQKRAAELYADEIAEAKDRSQRDHDRARKFWGLAPKSGSLEGVAD